MPVSAALVDWPTKEQGNTREIVNNRDRQILMASSWKLHYVLSGPMSIRLPQTIFTNLP
jgi:hypothetical protein